jgi:hypothetical protein
MFVSLSVLGAPNPAPAQQSPAAPARALVSAGIRAMGGEARLRALRGVRIAGIGHRNQLEQSERPEGPWLVTYEQVDELRDVAAGRLRQRTRQLGFGADDWQPTVRLYADGVPATVGSNGPRAGRMGDAARLRERLELAPERVLLTALAAPDLRAGRDTTFQGVPHHAVSFGWNGARVRLLLNAATSLPTAVEVTRPHPDESFWWVWGDVTLRTLYSMWSLEPGGIRYPRQWDTEWRGLPAESFTVLRLDLAAPAPDDSFAISASVRTAFAERQRKPAIRGIPLGEPFPGQEHAAPVEPAPGVVVIPGRWNTALVRQDDGVVVIEAPISSEYSAQVLAEAERRFPGARVKALVTTSDAWPHLAGIREYVARGIPVYALDLNRPILQRLMAAPFAMLPDSLARAPRPPDVHTVAAPVTLGSGLNRLELRPVRGEGGERMVMVYLPGRRLLYASDLLQPLPEGGFFFPQYAAEVAAAVRRGGLAVDSVFGMHLSPVPWQSVVDAVARAEQAPPPVR